MHCIHVFKKLILYVPWYTIISEMGVVVRVLGDGFGKGDKENMGGTVASLY